MRQVERGFCDRKFFLLNVAQVGQRCGLPLLSPVDDAGLFTDEAGAEFAGLAVLAEGNQAVITKLEEVGALLKVRTSGSILTASSAAATWWRLARRPLP